MADHSENRVTVWMSDDLVEATDERIDWKNHSRSGYVREGVQVRNAIQDELNRQGVTLPDDDSERDRLFRDIALAGVDAVADAESDG
jgi:hypothetical protein